MKSVSYILQRPPEPKQWTLCKNIGYMGHHVGYLGGPGKPVFLEPRTWRLMGVTINPYTHMDQAWGSQSCKYSEREGAHAPVPVSNVSAPHVQAKSHSGEDGWALPGPQKSVK